MKHVQMREAKAKLSELVADVEKGELVTITRHGVDVAVLVPVVDGRRVEHERERAQTVIDMLMQFPGDGTEFERDETPVREIDL